MLVFHILWVWVCHLTDCKKAQQDSEWLPLRGTFTTAPEHKHKQNHKMANCMFRCQTARPDWYLHLQLQTEAHGTLHVPKRYEITFHRHNLTPGNHGLHWHTMSFHTYNHDCSSVTTVGKVFCYMFQFQGYFSCKREGSIIVSK